MAVREGFEPSNGLTRYTLSRRAPSATRTPHLNLKFNYLVSLYTLLACEACLSLAATRTPHQFRLFSKPRTVNYAPGNYKFSGAGQASKYSALSISGTGRSLTVAVPRYNRPTISSLSLSPRPFFTTGSKAALPVRQMEA